MNNYRQLLERSLNLQQNAQNNLPVLPNNGNPGGAYNMRDPSGMLSRSSVVSTAPVVDSAAIPSRGYAFPWMEASPSVGRMRDLLDRPPINSGLRGNLIQQNAGQVGGVPHEISGRMDLGGATPQPPVMPQRTVGDALRRYLESRQPGYTGNTGGGVMPGATGRNPYALYEMPVIPTYRNN